jgi:hypothetical protein
MWRVFGPPSLFPTDALNGASAASRPRQLLTVFDEESRTASGSICAIRSLADDGYFFHPPEGGSFRYFTFTHLGEAPRRASTDSVNSLGGH